MTDNGIRTHKERKADLENLRQRLGIGENTSYKDYLTKAKGRDYVSTLQRYRKDKPPKPFVWKFNKKLRKKNEDI